MVKQELKIAIDPGWSGAMVWQAEGLTTFVEKCPATAADMNHLVENVVAVRALGYEPRCVLERVSAFPGQGVTSVWKFSANYHLWQGMLTAHRIPYQLVSPAKWQKHLGGLPSGKDKKKERKNQIKAFAQRLYPHLRVTLASADALAMLAVFDSVWTK